MNSDQSRIRIASWNIHGGIGHDGRYDLTRVGAHINVIAPDIAAFQEVDTRRRALDDENPYHLLRRKVGDHGYEAWSISGVDGNYGQMLASRYPLLEPCIHDISMPGREPRKAIDVHVELPAARIRVIATHLGLRRSERRIQIAKLRELLAQDPSAPTILLGDFNEWRPAFRVAPVHLDKTTRHATYPSRFPFLALDRISVRPASLMSRSWVAKKARWSSDHLPVVAELDPSALSNASVCCAGAGSRARLRSITRPGQGGPQ